MRHRALSSLTAALILSAAGAGQAQTITALLREGDPVGPSTVTVIDTVATNSVGGWGVQVGSADTVDRFWGTPSLAQPPAVLRAEGTIGPYTQTAFEGFWGLGDSGVVAYSPTLTGAPCASADSVFYGDTPVAVQGLELATVPGPGVFWAFASRPTSTSSEVWWVSGWATTSCGGTVGRGLFRGPTPTLVLGTGDAIAGIGETVTSGGPGFTFRVSAHGSHWIAPVDITGLSTANEVVVLDGAAATMNDGGLVREGTAVGVAAGGNGLETWQVFTNFGVNEAGQWLMVADTSAASTSDHVVVLTGQVVLREGEQVGGLTISGPFDSADLNEDGDWAVIWTVHDGVAPREAIIFNGALLIKETDPIDWDGDGTPDPGTVLTDITGIDNLYMSDRNPDGTVDIYFTGDTSRAGNNEAAYRIRVQAGAPCPADFNLDGAVTTSDVSAFLTAWFADIANATTNADFDDSGSTTTADISAFLSAWFAAIAAGGC